MKTKKTQDNNMDKWSNLKDLLETFKSALEQSTIAIEEIAKKEQEKVDRIKKTIEYKNGSR